MPKVIDFGIAKATESRLTNRTLFTRFHQFIGTPAYMSPEQTRNGRRKKSSTISSMLVEMFQSASPDSAMGKDYKVRQLLDDFSSRLNRQLDTEPEVEQTVRTTIGTAYVGLGDYVQAELHLRRAHKLAVEIHGEDSLESATAASRLGWLIHLIGSSDVARDELEAAVRLQEAELGARHDEVLRTKGYLAAVLVALDEMERAEVMAEGVLAAGEIHEVPNGMWVTQILAQIYRAQGREAEAAALGESVLAATESGNSGDHSTGTSTRPRMTIANMTWPSSFTWTSRQTTATTTTRRVRSLRVSSRTPTRAPGSEMLGNPISSA